MSPETALYWLISHGHLSRWGDVEGGNWECGTHGSIDMPSGVRMVLDRINREVEDDLEHYGRLQKLGKNAGKNEIQP